METKFTVHQTHHTIADFEGIFNYLEQVTTPGIHLFPELFLTGYPLQDLCLGKSFIQAYQKLLERIDEFATKLDSQTHLLMGGLQYELGSEGLPDKIKNVIYHISKAGVRAVYTKRLLPNYDIFDEKKYFHKGFDKSVIEIDSLRIGLLICEDMWSSTVHKSNPVLDYEGETLDCIVNLSASPFNFDKNEQRQQRAQDISHFLQAPFIYINRVGGEDEILFDGHSFICDGDEIVYQMPAFSADTYTFTLPKSGHYQKMMGLEQANTWESLFTPRLGSDLKIMQINDQECQTVLDALIFGLKEYATKAGFKNFSIALSGGLDSALVLTIAKMALSDKYVEAIYMPSMFSRSISYELSAQLCTTQNIPFFNLPIKFLHSTAKNVFGQTFSEPFEGITDENIQSRLRGMLLYTRSNQINSMVINTSNKSELAVGYSTQYGDSVGAISLLGDLYKSEVQSLARFINKRFGELIPEQIISRPPSAELRADQEDSQSLPPYPVLDSILEALLSNFYARQDLVDNGFTPEDIDKVFGLYRKSEYKRYQFAPIIKLTSRSFGFGYRVPISKNSNFYNC